MRAATVDPSGRLVGVGAGGLGVEGVGRMKWGMTPYDGWMGVEAEGEEVKVGAGR